MTDLTRHRSWFAVWQWSTWTWAVVAVWLAFGYFLSAAPVMFLQCKCRLAYRSDPLALIACKTINNFYRPAIWSIHNSDIAHKIYMWEFQTMKDVCWWTKEPDTD